MDFLKGKGLWKKGAGMYLSRLLKISRSALYRKPVPPDPEDQRLREAIEEEAMRDATLGYRKIHRKLRERGFRVGIKKVYRLYREMGLSIGVAHRSRRRQKVKAQGPSEVQRGAFVHDVWAMDFTTVQAGDRRLRVLVVMDEYSRKILHLEVAPSFGGYRTVAVLEEVMGRYGPPRRVRSDAGSEFRSRPFRKLLEKHRIQQEYRPGSPWANGVVERTIRAMKEEGGEGFSDFREAQKKLLAWRAYFNRVRPHASLDYRTPEEVYREGLEYPRRVA